MDAAEALISNRGFGGTSIDMILEACQVTKGMFFYYFSTKQALGHALALRVHARESLALKEISGSAHEQTEDPLEQLGLMLDALAAHYVPRGRAKPVGTILAIFVYESDLFTEDTRKVVLQTVRELREMFVSRLRQIKPRSPRSASPSANGVADYMVAMIEGGHILARVTGKPSAVADQLQHCKQYLQLLYKP